MKILRRQTGLSLVELMITMVIFVMVIAAASNLFTGLLTQFKQQSKIAETAIEGIVGLQMLRADIEQAGYGLPYDIGTADYDEAQNVGTTQQDETAFNDAGATDTPPRAVLTGAVAAGGNGLPNTYVSDVLVLKATNIAMNDTVRKWAAVSNTGAANTLTTWTNVATGAPLASENLAAADRVTVVIPLQGANQRILINSGGNFFTQFTNPLAAAFSPTANSYETYIVYGVSSGADPRMPFNRADYYVGRPATMPTHCAPQTGILYKSAVTNSTGAGGGDYVLYPLLDCVAAMKIVLARDTNADGITDSFTTAGAWPVLSGAGATPAADVRSQLKEVRVYVVTHEGQRDATFIFPTANLTVTDPDAGTLLTYTLPDRNYRWRTYTMVLKPYNLR